MGRFRQLYREVEELIASTVCEYVHTHIYTHTHAHPHPTVLSDGANKGMRTSEEICSGYTHMMHTLQEEITHTHMIFSSPISHNLYRNMNSELT